MGTPQTAPRMSLANMRSQDTLTAQFNPPDLKRMVAVNYARLGILGQTYEQLQFQFRPNEKLTFSLDFDRLSGQWTSSSAFLVQAVLDAMTAGSRGATDTASGGPPDVLFLWPGILAMVVRVTKLDYDLTRRTSFVDGTPTLFGVKVEVEESRTARLFAEDIRQTGLQRAGT